MSQLISFTYHDLEWNDDSHEDTCSNCDSYSTSVCYEYNYEGHDYSINRKICSTCRTLAYHELINFTTYY